MTRPRGALVAAAVLLVVSGLVMVAWNMTLPLVAYSPGPVSDAADAVIVDGGPSYPTDGELVMLTVAGQDINLFEVAVAAFDPTVEVVARQVVRRPDETDEEFRRRNLQMMDESTATAVGVALSTLGLDEAGGVFVTGYAADTPAGRVIAIGDRILAVDGVEVADTADLGSILEGRVAGDVIEVEVERAGERLRLPLELAPHPTEPERAVIGIFVRRLPFWVSVDPGIVGGPSAGLMYTLAIIDVLTPESLTGGLVVAGTGTIDPAGNVGTVGGVRQKVVAAAAAGARYMLVPTGNYEAARRAAHGEMELVPVSTLTEALDFLHSLP